MKTNHKVCRETTAGNLDAELRAFERQRARLLRRYPGQYVALSGGRVVDRDLEDEALAARMFKRLGDTPFYIVRLERHQTIFEFPSPEVAG